jgi:nucleotide sugar dehydrogenase
MFKIGIVGYGFVGKAMHKTFEHNSIAFIVDPKSSNLTIAEYAQSDPEIIFICLPAPTADDGSVDASLIYDVFRQLISINYNGIIVVKSTLPPNIARDLFDTFSVLPEKKLRYIYSPEFLRERQWETDAFNPSRIILAGNYHDCKIVERFYKNHSHVVASTRFMLADYTEAALIKYAANAFLATKVVFMNQLHQLYTDIHGSPQPEDWEAFTEILCADHRIGNSHTTVPGIDGKYGYGGTCFPKDVKAMNGFDKFDRLTLLQEAELANTQIRLGDK